MIIRPNEWARGKRLDGRPHSPFSAPPEPVRCRRKAFPGCGLSGRTHSELRPLPGLPCLGMLLAGSSAPSPCYLSVLHGGIPLAILQALLLAFGGFSEFLAGQVALRGFGTVNGNRTGGHLEAKWVTDVRSVVCDFVLRESTPRRRAPRAPARKARSVAMHRERQVGR